MRDVKDQVKDIGAWESKWVMGYRCLEWNKELAAGRKKP